MVFRTPCRDRLLKNDLGFPNGEIEPRSHADGLKLADWEVKVPISLTGYEGEPWVELEDPRGLTIRMSHRSSRKPEAPYIDFNVWGDPPQGYFSPEPWLGMQNSFNLRQGLISLEPGEQFEWTIRIEARRAI
jgi:galactose mutarotase-like enzyme